MKVLNYLGLENKETHLLETIAAMMAQRRLDPDEVLRRALIPQENIQKNDSTSFLQEESEITEIRKAAPHLSDETS